MLPHEKWLANAEEDLSFAKLGLREKFFSQVCFLSQQVVEKSLKSFLLFNGRSYPRSHKIIELAHLCKELGPDLIPLKNELKLLDEFYIPTRYPDAIPGGLSMALPGQRDAQEALQLAERIFVLVQEKLKS